MIIRLIIIILLTLFSFGCSEQEPSLTSQKITLNNLRQIDVRDYYGITVNSFLQYLDFSYKEHFWLTEPPLYLMGGGFVCNDSVEIYLLIDSIQYQQSYNVTGNWDIDKFMKEKIARIGIHINRKPVGRYFWGPPPKDKK